MLLAPAALATVVTGPITWLPAESTYGVAETPFVTVPMAPPGTGATALAPGAAFGAGFWDDGSEVYVMGFLNQMPPSMSMPGLAETELGLTPLFYGVPLELVFEKTAGQRINAVALLGDPDSLVSIEPADPATLTAATEFTVRATVTDPVQSASGNVGAAFGLSVDCSSLAARDFQNSLFVTDMHWLDIDPPTFTSAGLAGLSAHGSNGTEATFDGIFTPAFLTAMGFTDFNQVQGYVDLTAVTGLVGRCPDGARRRRRQPLAGGFLEVPAHQQPLVHAQHPVRPADESGQGLVHLAQGHDRHHPAYLQVEEDESGRQVRGAGLQGQQAPAEEDRRDGPLVESRQGAPQGRVAYLEGARRQLRRRRVVQHSLPVQGPLTARGARPLCGRAPLTTRGIPLTSAGARRLLAAAFPPTGLLVRVGGRRIGWGRPHAGDVRHRGGGSRRDRGPADTSPQGGGRMDADSSPA